VVADSSQGSAGQRSSTACLLEVAAGPMPPSRLAIRSSKAANAGLPMRLQMVAVPPQREQGRRIRAVLEDEARRLADRHGPRPGRRVRTAARAQGADPDSPPVIVHDAKRMSTTDN